MPDGTFDATGTISTDADPLRLSGPDAASGYPNFKGGIDESRVSSSVRSADWIEAQYLSQSNTFNTYCAEAQ